MPLLRNGRPSDVDAWTHLADDASLPGESSGVACGVPVTVSLARFLELATSGTGTIAGVRLAPDDDALALGPWLDRLQLVTIEFPTFADGRGYSQARRLRSRLGFAGEIRAVGDVRPDQVPFMMRAGIDAFDFASPPDDELLHRALSRYRTSYQPSYALPIAG